jgi:shikimate kinase
MKSNVALVGFMGAGKTVVGKSLASTLGKDYIETDLLVEQRAGKAISDIFAHDGEVAFRELEIEVIRDVARARNTVLACGGGVVLNWINIARLKDDAVIVYLKASAPVLLRRAASDGTLRPLLVGQDTRQRVRQLLRFRRPLYERAADVTIDTSRLEVGDVVKEIVMELERDASVN